MKSPTKFSNYLAIFWAAILALLLLSCDTSGSSAPLAVETTSELEVVETNVRADYMEQEIILLNNCDGKADISQVAERGQAVQVQNGIELGTHIAIFEGAISTKYSTSSYTGKSIILTAPPGTHMRFILMWTIEEHNGKVIRDELPQATYRYLLPIDIQVQAQNDLGCNRQTTSLTPESPSEPLLAGTPSSWLPNSYSIPDDLIWVDGGSNPNKEVAEQYQDPTQVLEKLQEWGRITGYYDEYLNRDGCVSKPNAITVSLGAVMLETSRGAKQYLEWIVNSSGPLRVDTSISFTQAETTNLIGEAAYFRKTPDFGVEGCTLRFIHVDFQRYNILGSVTIGYVPDSMAEEDAQALAIQFAKLIDLKLMAAAK